MTDNLHPTGELSGEVGTEVRFHFHKADDLTITFSETKKEVFDYISTRLAAASLKRGWFNVTDTFGNTAIIHSQAVAYVAVREKELNV